MIRAVDEIEVMTPSQIAAGLGALIDRSGAASEVAQLVLARQHTRTVLCRHGRIAVATETLSSSGRVMVWRAGKHGVATGTCIDLHGLAALLATARRMAHVDAEPPHPSHGEDTDCELVGDRADPRLITATPADVVSTVRRLLALVQEASSELVAETLTLSVETSSSARRTGQAAVKICDGSRLWWAISIMKRVAATSTSLVEVTGCDTHWERGAERLAHDLGAVARRLGGTTGIMALDRGARHRTVLTPTAVADLVLPYLTFQLAGASQLGGNSALVLGAPATLPALLTIRDDPHAPEAFRACERDREGTPTRPQILIDRGALVTPIAGRQSAAAMGVAPPGLAGGPFGLAIDAGDLEDEHLARDLGPLLHIGTFAGDLDRASGRFSGVAKGCWLERAGSDSTFIEDFAISGNVLALLSSVLHLGRRRDWVRGEALCPSLLVESGVEY